MEKIKFIRYYDDAYLYEYRGITFGIGCESRNEWFIYNEVLDRISYINKSNALLAMKECIDINFIKLSKKQKEIDSVYPDWHCFDDIWEGLNEGLRKIRNKQLRVNKF